MSNGGFIEIQILEPIVIEVEAPTIPLIPTVSSPPIGISIPPPISLSYECPLSIYCGTDTPCGWSWVMPSLPIPTIPVFSFPPQFQIPSYGFRFEVPPPIFVKCPAFPEKDFEENKERDGEKENVPGNTKVEATDTASASAEEHVEDLKTIL
jgi:hypothetical protein